MTNIGHFRAAAKILEGEGYADSRLWVCPPTKMDAEQLTKEGILRSVSLLLVLVWKCLVVPSVWVTKLV